MTPFKCFSLSSSSKIMISQQLAAFSPPPVCFCYCSNSNRMADWLNGWTTTHYYECPRTSFELTLFILKYASAYVEGSFHFLYISFNFSVYFPLQCVQRRCPPFGVIPSLCLAFASFSSSLATVPCAQAASMGTRRRTITRTGALDPQRMAMMQVCWPMVVFLFSIIFLFCLALVKTLQVGNWNIHLIFQN
jgi:hypothetical protein